MNEGKETNAMSGVTPDETTRLLVEAFDIFARSITAYLRNQRIEFMKANLAIMNQLKAEGIMKSDSETGEKVNPENTSDREKSSHQEEQHYTKEEVRAVLSRVAKAGFRQEVMDLLKKYHATNLREVDPKDYTALVEEAEGFNHG